MRGREGEGAIDYREGEREEARENSGQPEFDPRDLTGSPKHPISSTPGSDPTGPISHCNEAEAAIKGWGIPRFGGYKMWEGGL